jgi:hypothetical protein
VLPHSPKIQKESIFCVAGQVSVSQQTGPLKPSSPYGPIPALAERVREILAGRNLTFSKVSQECIRLFPTMRHGRIPRNFYQDLRRTTLTPNIFQVFALSAVSGYRLADWLRLFGFPLEQIPRLQLLMPAKRTTLLDSLHSLELPQPQWTSDFRRPVELICPLGRLLRANPIRLVTSEHQPEIERYLYARIGAQDAFAFPDLLPGSILRVDTREPERFLPLRNGEITRAFFLIEHALGMVCCRLRRTGTRRVALHTSHLAYAPIKSTIADSVNVVVHVERRPGRRFIAEVLEIQHYDPDTDTFDFRTAFATKVEAA